MGDCRARRYGCWSVGEIWEYSLFENGVKCKQSLFTLRPVFDRPERFLGTTPPASITFLPGMPEPWPEPPSTPVDSEGHDGYR